MHPLMSYPVLLLYCWQAYPGKTITITKIIESLKTETL